MADSTPETIRRCDCYRAKDVLILFGWTNARGEPVPISRETLRRRRKSGKIPFIAETSRLFLYPKAKIDALITRTITVE